jgi:hypothetical protein
MIPSVHIKSCKTAQKCFLLFKGPGPLKKIKSPGIDAKSWPIEWYHSHPLPCHFTVPLSLFGISALICHW